MDGIKTTTVSPSIMRQIPCYESLKNNKHINVEVHFDYLRILVEELNTDLEDLGLEVLRKFKSRVFDSGKRVKLQGRYFSLLEGPIFFCPYNFGIDLNPRDFNSFQEYTDFLSLIVGQPIMETPHRITRLDLAFTADKDTLHPALINFGTHAKWKRNASKFVSTKVDMKTGEISGFRTNSKSMDVSSYSEEYNQKDGEEHSSRVRFELQMRRCSLDSLKIRDLHQLKNLQSVEIFKRIEFYDVALTTAVKKEAEKRFIEFQLDVLAVGFQQARLLNNKQRNFQRDIGRYLVPFTVNSGKARLSYILKKRFDSWFDSWRK